jgi:hypothetical protein
MANFNLSFNVVDLMWDFFFFNFNFLRKNCTIGPCGWPKLQIAPFDIQINLEILVVCLIYKSLTEVKFR